MKIKGIVFGALVALSIGSTYASKEEGGSRLAGFHTRVPTFVPSEKLALSVVSRISIEESPFHELIKFMDVPRGIKVQIYFTLQVTPENRAFISCILPGDHPIGTQNVPVSNLTLSQLRHFGPQGGLQSFIPNSKDKAFISGLIKNLSSLTLGHRDPFKSTVEAVLESSNPLLIAAVMGLGWKRLTDTHFSKVYVFWKPQMLPSDPCLEPSQLHFKRCS